MTYERSDEFDSVATAMYGKAVTLVDDRLKIFPACWHRNGMTFKIGYGFKQFGYNCDILGVVAERIRKDGRPKTRWQFYILALRGDKHYVEVSPYNCPEPNSNSTIPKSDVVDLVIGHLLQKFPSYLTSDTIDKVICERVNEVVGKYGIVLANKSKHNPKTKKTSTSSGSDAMIIIILRFTSK